MSYNGYSNYETWCVSLWIDNEEPSYRYWRSVAEECKEEAPTCRQVRDGYWEEDRAAVFLLEDRLKEEISDSNPLIEQANMWADLLNAALSEVDWREIAENMLEEN